MVLRTPKFVNALAYGPAVINTEFVTQCLETNELLDPSAFPLVDKASESKYKFTISDATARAKANKNKLLKGYHVCCTETIRGGYDTFRSIVVSNGGECVLFRGRLALPNSFRHEGDDESTNHGQKEVYLLTGATAEQTKLWPRFRQMVQDMNKIPRIVRIDWLLDIAMSQKLLAADGYELDDDNIKMVE